jgi:enolase
MEGKPEGFVRFKNIALCAMLQCKGSNEVKAKILYHVLQAGAGGAEFISATDKDFEPGLNLLLDIAVRYPCKAIEDPRGEEMVEKYKAIAEKFTDDVFDVKAKLFRTDWEAAVASRASYLLDPAELRAYVFAF